MVDLLTSQWHAQSAGRMMLLVCVRNHRVMQKGGDKKAHYFQTSEEEGQAASGVAKCQSCIVRNNLQR